MDIDLEEPAFAFIYKYVEKEKFTKYFRLFIFICLYIFVRTYYLNWSKQREVRKRLEQDKIDKELEPERLAKAEAAESEKLELEAQLFGWGKATRRKVKAQESFLQKQADDLRMANQSAYDAQEDHDIDYLLEE